MVKRSDCECLSIAPLWGAIVQPFQYCKWPKDLQTPPPRRWRRMTSLLLCSSYPPEWLLPADPLSHHVDVVDATGPLSVRDVCAFGVELPAPTASQEKVETATMACLHPTLVQQYQLPNHLIPTHQFINHPPPTLNHLSQVGITLPEIRPVFLHQLLPQMSLYPVSHPSLV